MVQYCSSSRVMEPKTISKNGEKSRNEVQGKRCLALIAFLFVTIFSFAQSNLQDVVYLKNGSIIRGVITELSPNQPVKIETADRNVFVFQWEEIERITKEPSPNQRSVTASRNSTGLQRGYKGIAELGSMAGDGVGAKVLIINGYQFNPHFSLGIGTGLMVYEGWVGIPLFADFRVNFIDKRVSPYFSAGIGYNIVGDGLGTLINLTPGVTFKVGRNKNAINVGLGYEALEVQSEYYWNYRWYGET